MNDDDVNRLRTAFGRIARTVDRQGAGESMTRSQLSVLGTIARLESVGMGELAELEGLNPTMLSRLVGKLEVQGLVQRSSHPEDRRSVRVGVTAQGAALHVELRRQRSALLADRLSGMPPEQLAALLAAIPALESLAEAIRPAQPFIGAR